MGIIAKFGDFAASKDQVYDMGLRRHMLSIYTMMAQGIGLTFAVGLVLQLFAIPAMLMQSAGGGILGMALIFAPLLYVFLLGKEITTGSLAKGRTLYWTFCALMGFSMSFVFERYTGASIAVAFLSTTIAFAGLSLTGYTTKMDLTPWRGFLIMGVWGLIGAGIINIFFGTALFDMAISAAGVLIFAALTALDTQVARKMYREGHDEMNQRAVVWSALELYLDFINIMLYLLRFVGVKKD